MTDRVCPKHEEYCPEGVCRWCESETTAGEWLANWKPVPAPVVPPFRYLGIEIAVDPSLDANEVRCATPNGAPASPVPCCCRETTLPPESGGQLTMGPNGPEEHGIASCILPSRGITSWRCGGPSP